MTAEPAAGRCVAWSLFSNACLASIHQNVGPVFLIESDWTIPNTISPEGLPHRQELRQVLDDAPGFRDRDVATVRTYEVLARADLGHRRTYRALEDAAAMIDVLLGVVINRGGASSWRQERLSCLIVDRTVNTITFGPRGRGGSGKRICRRDLALRGLSVAE